MFEELEAFCVKHGIAFDRHSDARYEFDAENVSFRTGMKEPVSIPSNNDGEDIIQRGSRPSGRQGIDEGGHCRVEQGEAEGGGGKDHPAPQQPPATGGRTIAAASAGLTS